MFEITIAAIISLVNRQFGATNVLEPYLVLVSVFSINRTIKLLLQQIKTNISLSRKIPKMAKMSPDDEVINELGAKAIDVTKEWVKNLCKRVSSLQELTRLRLKSWKTAAVEPMKEKRRRFINL